MNHSKQRSLLSPVRLWLALLIAGVGLAPLVGHARAADDKPARERGTVAPKQEPLDIDEEWDNPDLPGFLRGKIDMSDYMRLRQEGVDERRGLPLELTAENPHPRVDAIRQMESQERILSRRLKVAGLAPLTWTPVGPAPIPNGQTTSIEVPVNGRVSAIAVHPTNPNIVYVGAAQGGVFRSLDGGNTWTPIFDSAASQAIGAIAIAPSQPSTVYVGTGEPNLSGDSFFGVGLYRIDNADTTPVLNGPINPIPTGDVLGTAAFTGRSIATIVVHPTNPDVVFVGTTSGIAGIGATAFSGTVPPLALRGLYRSVNATAATGSVAFTKLTVVSANNVAPDTTGNVSVMDLAFEPGNPANLVVSVMGVLTTDGGLYRSTNALDPTPSAVTFTQTKVMAAGIRANLAINKIASTVTVLAASGESAVFSGSTCPSGSGRVYRSVDGGVTWGTNPLAGSGGFCGGQCFYDAPVGLDPLDSNKISMGGAGNGACSRDYTRSTDGGATFSVPGTADVGLHADAHAIAIANAPNNNVVYIGNDGGIFRSNDYGATWNSLNNAGFNAAQFSSVALHPTDREFMIGGTQDNGTHLKKADGSWFRADFGDGGYARIDQNATDTENVTLYHTYFNQANAMGFARVDRVADAQEGNWPFFGCGFVAPPGNGLNCSPAATAILFYAPVELGPGNPNTVYFGSDRLFRSANKGVTMQLVSQGPIQSGVAVSTIGISPQDDNVRIVGMRFGKVFATTTGSSPLTDVTGPWTTGNVQPRPFVSRAMIDPNNPNTAYVTFATYCAANVACAQVWKTTNLNGGPPTWTKANSGIPDVPVDAFLIDPRNSSSLYAGTDIGVYNSTDGGASWAPYGGSLPRVAVFELALNRPTGTLRAVTHGRGMWEVRAGAATPVFSNLSSPVIIPGQTPTVLGGTIKAGTLVPPGSVNITLDTVGTGSAIIQSDGSFSFSFDTSGLAPGSYGISYVYPGAAGDFNPATGNGTLTVAASLALTTTTITAPTVTYPSNANVTVTVTSGSGTPTGNVSLVVDGGAPLVQPLVAGSATFVLVQPGGGSHSLVATYARNATWEASSASGVLIVNKATPVFSKLLFPTIALGQSPSIPSGVISAGGAAPTGNVVVTLNGSSRAALIDSSTGIFSTRFDTSALALGTYTLSYAFAGDSNFSAVSQSGTLTVATGTVNAVSNSAVITINDVSPATPYPSVINVSGVAGKVMKATVTLNQLSHTFVGDVGVLLISPDGKSTVLLYSPNTATSAVNFNYTFDDAGPPFTGAPGTYQPTQSQAVPNFPGAAPIGPYGTTLFQQNGAQANGAWKLYVEDHGAGDTGAINGGWTLTLTTGGAGYTDFNKDGRTDILWRNQSTGDNIAWYMTGDSSGVTVAGGAVLMPIADTNWKIGGTADFNNDGLTDILWRNQSTGDNIVWFMDGTTITGGAVLPAIADTHWIIAATGDFNGDGQRDILWRNTSTGDNIVWFMNGVTVSGGTVLMAIADPNWVVGGTGDFNGDGQTDIVWRNQATGDNIVWFMNGTTVTGGTTLLSIADPNWFLEAIGDFTADGQADIVWRNEATGDNVVWFMNGTTITGGSVLPSVPAPWTIRGPR